MGAVMMCSKGPWVGIGTQASAVWPCSMQSPVQSLSLMEAFLTTYSRFLILHYTLCLCTFVTSSVSLIVLFVHLSSCSSQRQTWRERAVQVKFWFAPPIQTNRALHLNPVSQRQHPMDLLSHGVKGNTCVHIYHIIYIYIHRCIEMLSYRMYLVQSFIQAKTMCETFPGPHTHSPNQKLIPSYRNKVDLIQIKLNPDTVCCQCVSHFQKNCKKYIRLQQVYADRFLLLILMSQIK